MSRVADILYFAPNLSFSKVDWSGGNLPNQFQQRIAGFYLKPALDLAPNYAFASGVLVVCAIDALAQLKTGTSGVTARITDFCRKIPDLGDGQNAVIFCEDFRHGLVHGARIKNGSEFSMGTNRIAIADHGRLVVNPKLLAEAVIFELKDFVNFLYKNPDQKRAFCKKLKRKFQYERSL